MYLISRSNPAIRLSIGCLAVFALGAAALAQNGADPTGRVGRPDYGAPLGDIKEFDQRKPYKTIDVPAPVIENTEYYFPQINVFSKQKNIRPANPKEYPNFVSGPPNQLKAGAVGGETGVDFGPKFPGMGYTGAFPPDPDIAVGPTHIVQVVNGGIAFFNKQGQKVFQQPDSNTGFWSGLSATPFIFDPKVVYDQIAQRFYIVELEQSDSAKTSHILIAVSDDNNPNGVWMKYRIPVHETKDSIDYWFDYPGWGYNKDAVICSGNMFPFASGPTYRKIMVIKKSELLAGGALTPSFFETNDFTVQIAKTFDATTPYIYGVAAINSTSQMRIFGFSDLTATPVMHTATVGVPAYTMHASGYAPSLGGKNLDVIPWRVISSHGRNGRIVAAHTIGVTGQSNKAQVRWYEFNAGTWPASGLPTLVQSGNVQLPGDQHAFMPGIATNNAGDISMIMTRSSQNISADAIVTSRKATDPLGQMGAPQSVGASDGATLFSFSRWGDYHDVEVDPSDNLTFWGVAELNQSNGLWTTVIANWQVSTTGGGGGGGGGGGIDANSITTSIGTYLQGDVDSTKTSDNSYYIIRSETFDRIGEYAAAELQFTNPFTAANTTSLAVNVEAIATGGQRVTGSVFFWNYSTGAWDFIRSYNVPDSGNESVQTKIVKNVSNYVNGAKTVRVLVRTHEPIRRFIGKPRAHTLRIDKVSLDSVGS